MVSSVIIDHENMGIDTVVVTFSCIISAILKKILFSIMAVGNLHIGKINTCYNFFMVSIVISDHENMGIDTICVTLSCILSAIMNKLGYLIMAALICI